MKKILLTLVLVLSFTGISLAQIEAVQSAENLLTETEVPQVEFYSSVEDFNIANPSFFMHMMAFIISQEIYEQMKNNALPVKAAVVSL